MLEHRIYPAAVGRQIVEALASHKNFAGSGAFETGNDAEQRRFARTTFAQDGEEFSLCHLQRDVAQHCGLAERLRQVADLEQRSCGRCRGVVGCGFAYGGHVVLSNFVAPASRRLSEGILPSESRARRPRPHYFVIIVLLLLRSRLRCTSRGAAHSARSKDAPDSCPHRRDAAL